MSKANGSKVKVRRVGTEELFYRDRCEDYRERDELENLNRRTAERMDEMQRQLWEREAKSEYARVRQEKRLNGMLKLLGVFTLSAVITAALGLLWWLEALHWGVCLIGCAAALIAGAFRIGFICHEIRG